MTIAGGTINFHWAQTLIGDTRTTGANLYYHPDALGTTRAITNSSQTKTDTLDTDAFGLSVVRTGSTSPLPMQFGGQEGYWTHNSTGLLRLGHRYYDPSTGRFISRDPAQSGYNWYTHCDNDPVNRIDPEGLGWRETWRAILHLLGWGQEGAPPPLPDLEPTPPISGPPSEFPDEPPPGVNIPNSGEGGEWPRPGGGGSGAGTGAIVTIGIGAGAAGQAITQGILYRRRVTAYLDSDGNWDGVR